MGIITLTSDWGLKDHYAGSVRGTILKQLPEAKIVDISHDVPPFSIKEAAFIVKNAYPNFPEGTVHIIGINTEESDIYPHVAVSMNGQYFIGSDNGIFALILDEEPEQIIELNIPQDSDLFTFSTRDRFVKAAVHLASGKKLSELGEERSKLTEKILFKPVIEKDVIKGMVIYVDNYENVITNITRDLFLKSRNGRKFRIVFRGGEISNISDSYSEVPVGEILALFGTTGHLEIAMNNGTAGSLLGLEMDDPVRIEFMQ